MAPDTEQEQFWQGEFGDRYVQRNSDRQRVATYTAFFSRVLACTQAVNSVLELGSNIGQNLAAIRQLRPAAELAAVEINRQAGDLLLKNMPAVELHRCSILDFQPHRTWDLVFTRGVLIHLPPDRLNDVYHTMYNATARYLMVAEYYNPQPVTLTYRGHDNKLFKRDFAGELLDRFSDLRLIDYGFVYHRDPNWPQDDISWFVMAKNH